MFQSINRFKSVEVNKELVCILADECITRLIHCHRDTRQTDFAYCTSCCNKNSVYRIETAIAMSQTFLGNCLFSGESVRKAYIFRSKKRYIAIPIRAFTSFRCATAENLNHFSKADFCFCLIIEICKQSSGLLL